MRRGERILKRGIAVVLQAALIAGVMTGCGKSKSDSDNLLDQASKSSKDYVFKAETVDFLPDGDYSNLQMVGDRIYASTYAENGFMNVYSFKQDGSDLQTVRFSEKTNESYGYMAYDNDGNMYCIHSIYDWSDYDEDGPILYEEEEQIDTDPEAPAEENATDESSAENSDAASDDAGDSEFNGEDYIETDGDQQYLCKFDSTGKEIFSVDLNSYKKDDLDFYAYSIVYTEKDGVIISSSYGIGKFDEGSQKVVPIIDTTENGSEFYDMSISLYKGANDKLFASYWGDKGMEFRSFDPATGNFGETSKVFTGYGDYSFFSGNGYDIYVSSNDGFYGFDPAKDTLTKILDYMDSDLELTYGTSSVVALSDTEFLANIPDEEYNYTMYRLTKVPADQVQDREIITLAGNYIGYDMRQKATAFNRENDKYRIKILDYSKYVTEDDWTAGQKQMNLDIASGNIPDIMVFDSDVSLGSYINKGLFVDFNTLFEKDPELKKEKFVKNVIEALSTDDKLYQLPDNFYVASVATKTKYLQGRTNLSIKDCDELIQQAGIDYSKSYGLCSKESILYSGLSAAGRSYIDWDNRKCNFDSDEFVEFLEFVNKFPTEISDSEWEQYDESCYRNGTALFYYSYISNFRSYKRIEAGEFGDDITMIGFPNDLGENCSIICPSDRFTISAQSKNIDGAWQFVRQFFTEEYQDELEYCFPILQSSFDKVAELSLEKEFYLDEDGTKNYVDDSYYIGDTEITIPPLTRDELEEVKQFIYGLNKVYDYNENVYNIINEEASAFFSGQKSAEEVAQIIQSRVSIYVNENS